jgi:adenosylcobinamide-phosphate synthase
MGLMAAASVGLSLAFDALFEEFPSRVHPVSVFGRFVAPFDGSSTAPVTVGALVAAVLPIVAAAMAGGSTAVAAEYDPRLGVVVASLVLFSTTSLRMLLSTVVDVVAASRSDPSAARDALIGLVGRDASELSPGEIRSAALESASENLADGLVAPLSAFAVGAQVSLPFAVGVAAWIKAVNTLDSMLGYRSKPVGRASARLDDVVMWLPARLSAVLIAFAGLSPGALRHARSWRGAPSSPNSGWPMATLAAVLDVQLSKRGHYALNPGAKLPTTEDARTGVRIVGIAGVLSFLLAGVSAWL